MRNAIFLLLVLFLVSCTKEQATFPATQPPSELPELWFSPNLASRDYLQLFTQPASWENSRRDISVFKFYVENIVPGIYCDQCENNTFERLASAGAFSKLRQWNITIAMETGAVKHFMCAQHPGKPFLFSARQTIDVLQLLEKHNTSVTYIAMDEPIIGGVQVINGESCNFTLEQTADAVASYHHRVLEQFPSSEIGDIEAYPLIDRSTANTTAFQIQKWIQLLEEREVHLAFFHLDVNMEAVEAWGAPFTTDIKTLKNFFKTRQIPFGIIITANHWRAQNDEEYVKDSYLFAKKIKALHIKPDHIIVQSWYDAGGKRQLPHNLPENKTSTHTNLVLAIHALFADSALPMADKNV